MLREMKPAETRVCVTGASGYIASHVVRVLLERGYQVRGTVRDLSDPRRVDHLRKIASDAGGRDRFEQLIEFRRTTTEDIGDRRSPIRFPHPWFGPMAAHRWLCFVPFHQRIHLRQARSILTQVDSLGMQGGPESDQ